MIGMPMSPMPAPTPEQIEQAQAIVDACTWEEVSAVLRSDDRRNYTIDVETDATAFEDEEQEKASRIEFVTAITAMLEKAIPAVQGNPSLAPLMKELTMFSVGAFKIGRPLEEAFEDAFNQIKDMPPPPNPEAEKAKADMAMKQQDLQARMAEKQADAQLRQQERQQDMEAKAREFELNREKMVAELDMKRQEFVATLEMKRQELGLKSHEMQLKRESSTFEQGMRYEEMQAQRQDAEYQRAASAEDREMKRRDMDERRAADIADKEMRRDVETSTLSKRAQQHADTINTKAMEAGEASLRSEIGGQVQAIADQIQQAFDMFGGQQQQIAEAITSLAQSQEQSTQALTAIALHTTAERRLKTDPKTKRVIGVDIVPGAADLRQAIEQLTKRAA